jgi:hypothetical protein
MAVSTQKPVECFATSEVIKMLREEFNEAIMFDGVNKLTEDKSKIALFVNSQTGTWTLIEYDTNNACVLGAGQSSST